MTKIADFAFTLNYDDESFERRHNLLKSFLKANCKQWIYQHEEGEESKRPHLQGYFKLNDRKLEGTIKNQLSALGVGAEISIASNEGRAALKTYCLKQDTRVGKQYSDKCPNGVDEIDVNTREEKYIYEINLRPWQDYLAMYLEQNQDDREILWIVDPVGGRGKSALIKYLVSREQAGIITVAKASDILYTATKFPKKSYIVDLSRTRGESVGDDELYQALEALKNGCWLSTKYECKEVCRDWTNIIVMANEVPCLTKMSLDRWTILTLTDNYQDKIKDELRTYEYNREGSFWRVGDLICPGYPMSDQEKPKRKILTYEERCNLRQSRV